jgi:PAS domain S-box-containing protein
MTTVENISVSSFYESIIENAESNILILDKNFSIVGFNPGFYWVFLETFDINLKKGNNLFEIMAQSFPEIAERWKGRCQAAVKGLAISDEEDLEAHGQQFSWKIYYKAVRLGAEQFISIYSRNVSANKLFHKKILMHEANLRTIINSFNASIWLVNTQLELIDFNDHTFTHFLKTYNVSLLPGKNFLELLPEAISGLRQTWYDRLRIALLSKETTSYLDHINMSGEEIICETRIIPVFSDGGVIGLTVSMEDITQKRIDEQLQRAQVTELIKLNSELDKFVYSASHDLRAPLLSIIGVLNLMKRESPNNQLYFNHIESSVRKLDNFVTNIINYSRNSKLDIIPEQIDFDKIVERVWDALSYLEGSLVVKCNQSINEHVKLHTDFDRLSIIFRNILANAFQYYDKKKKSTLHISADITREVAIISFSDNGIGIDSALQPRVFEMFFRATDTSNGSGLGLYVAKNAVEKLGGKIYLTSTLGVGTEVTIHIPNMIALSQPS